MTQQHDSDEPITRLSMTWHACVNDRWRVCFSDWWAAACHSLLAAEEHITGYDWPLSLCSYASLIPLWMRILQSALGLNLPPPTLVSCTLRFQNPQSRINKKLVELIRAAEPAQLTDVLYTLDACSKELIQKKMKCNNINIISYLKQLQCEVKLCSFKIKVLTLIH